MDAPLSDESLGQKLGRCVKVVRVLPLTGGSINNCFLLELDKGVSVFVKTHRGKTCSGMYAAEFKALQLLKKTASLCVPDPLYFDEQWLILADYCAGQPCVNWQERMGRGLALLHQASRQEKFGFHCNNFLGSSIQLNQWHDQWLSFWAEQRLEYQLKLFSSQVNNNDPLLHAVTRLLGKLDTVLASDEESAVLLHGDLWSGNAAANQQGEPVIYDPASYYGHREAEFGMMRLFGGFGPECEAAYQEIWPFQAGFDRRIEVYKLYHQLNHLNLFGGSYYEACLTTIKNIL